MGYYSRLSGGFDIEPPITYKEFLAAGYSEEALVTPKVDLDIQGGYGELFFTINRERVKTDDGYTVAVWCDRIDPYDDQLKAYGVNDTIKHLEAVFGPTHTFTGTVRIFGEEDGDIWRIRADGSKFITEHPKLVWPDGSTSSL
jgi:hypothetical protein